MTLRALALTLAAPLALAVSLTAGAARADCPTWQYDARAHISGSEQQFRAPQRYDVVAGGRANLNGCPVPGTGFVAAIPDFELNYQSVQGADLNLRVESACDTTLLVNTANATWFFDDDTGGALQPSLRLPQAGSGTYDIWVGTYSPALCQAQLIVEAR